MKRRHVHLLGIATTAAVLSVPLLARADRPPVAGGYAIVVSERTQADPAWAAVVKALQEKHRDRQPVVVTWTSSPAEAAEQLAACMPRHACFVAPPGEAGRRFVADVHRLTRTLDDDPYGDVLWGILTGYDAANALAARLNDGLTDLFVTSGHATERDWQIGFRYKNGQFRSAAGRLRGVDTAGTEIPIDSPNPKIWLPIGNCLAGHIDGPDALALAFLNAGGVRQMIGYTVPTWFGYACWGLLDYFLEQPGRFTLCEAFHANQHALVHRLETNAAPADTRGLTFDREVVAFYGDPAWEARMADGRLQFRQALTEHGGVFTLEIVPLDGPRSFAPVNTNGSQRGGRPVVQFLPRRLTDVEIVAGAEFHPVVTDDVVLVPLPAADSTDTVRVVFRGGQTAQ